MNITIPKIKIRRGSDADRKLVTIDQGEPIFTVDTQRFFVGDGISTGAVSIGAKIHFPVNNYTSLSSINAQVGDLVYTNNIFYQLTSSNFSNIDSWKNVGLKINDDVFEYDGDNYLTFKVDSLFFNKLSGLTLKNGSISSSNLNHTIFGRGISGGNGNDVELIIDPEFFKFDGDVLSFQLSSTETSIISSNRLIVDPTFFSFDGHILTFNLSSTETGPISSQDLDDNLFGGGFYKDVINSKIELSLNPSLSVIGGDLTVNPIIAGSGLSYNTTTDKLSTTLTDVNNTLTRSSTGVIGIKNSLFSSGFIFDTINGSLSTILTDCDETTITKDSHGVISIDPDMFGDGLYYDVATDTLSSNISFVGPSLSSLDGTIHLNPSIIGGGLTYNPSIPLLSATSAVINSDNITITNDAGILKLPTVSLAATFEHSKTVIDVYGRVTELTNSINDTLSGTNGSGLLSALFSGTPAHSLSGAIPGISLTTFTALSSDGSTITLSSAGFLVFSGNETARSGQPIGRYAIPIFTF